MFGNFGSLRETQTQAGMGGSSGSAGSLDSGSLGSTGSSGSSQSAGDAVGSLSNPLGSMADNEFLTQQLETGSLGNGLSGSLDLAVGSAYGFPQWVNGDQGTIPVLKGPTKITQLLTGPTSPFDTPDMYAIGGTDLGFMWDNGNDAKPQVLMAFGDTMGDCSIPGNQWRGNVMFRSDDRDLSDGLSLSAGDGVLTGTDGLAKEMVPRTGKPGEVTIIPTSGVSVDGKQYLRYMSVSRWGVSGTWDTNYSGLAVSEDNGETWTPQPAMARRITNFAEGIGENPPAVDGKWARAQMSGFVKGQDDDYLYEYLTPSGRLGSAILSRVAQDEAKIGDPGAYEYWNGGSWVSDINAAKPVFGAPVSELSVQWHPGLRRYVAMYSSGLRSVMVRTAPSPTGPWSQATTLIDYSVLPGAYGGFIHPWSTGKDLDFVVTTWNSYNVYLAHTDLSQISLPGTDGISYGTGGPQAGQTVQTGRRVGAVDGGTNTDAPAVSVAETGTTVERTVSRDEVEANGGVVPEN